MAGNTFTTYLNAKRSGSVDAEFAALEQRGGKAFSTIQKNAEAANRAVAGIGRNNPLNQWKVPPRTGQDLEALTSRTEHLRQAQERLARENSSLVRALRTTGQTLQVVQGPLGPIAGRVSAAADALTRLTGVTLGLAGAGAALFAYATAANRFVEIRSKLMPLFDSQEQVNDALGKVAGIAQRARSGLEPIVDLYSKMKLAADQFGISQERGLRITELAAKAATLSGGTAQSRESGLYQFSQGFGSGALGGDELKSVKENTLSLARALSEGLGKLPEFKGIDTSIGKLKVLGEQGKLTTDVIARALEAAAGSIEEKFGRLPVTLGSAFTQLQNSATLFVGKFEEATGVVGILAQGVQLLGNNLGPIVSILGGIAAAWAAVAAAKRASDAVDSVRSFATRLTAERTAANAALAAATGLRSQTVLQTASLAAQERVIRSNIVALEQELQVQRQLAAEAEVAARVAPAGPGRRLAADANAAAARTTHDLATEVEKLSTVQVEGATAARKLEGATKAVDIAKQGAAKSSSLLKNGLRSLIGTINPVGIAVGLATSAFLAWATAESKAEENAKKVEDAQRSLAKVIDFTTGKIIEQNAALVAAERLKASQGVAAAQENYLAQRANIAKLAEQFRPSIQGGGDVAAISTPNANPNQRRAAQLLDAYGRGQGTSAGLVVAINALAKADPSLRALANTVTDLGGKATEAAQQGERLAASGRLLAGQNTAENRRRAEGDFSGGRNADQAAAGLTDAQVNAKVESERKKLRDKRYAAEVQMNESLTNLEGRRSKMTLDAYIREKAQIKASYDSALTGLDKQDAALATKAQREEERRKKAHERELARIEAENQAREKRTEKRSDILQGYSAEPKPVVKARDQIEDLQRMVGDTLNGIAAITKENPLGQGIYTADMAKADAAHIYDGLQRPYNDYLETRQRDLELSGLIASGHELEAEALRQATTLAENGATIRKEQYDAILAGLQAEQRINDVLAERERLLAPLKSSVEALRGTLSSTIEDFLNTGDLGAAGKNLFKGLLSSFNKATAEQLAAKLTSGLDARVRDLINGSVKVDDKIADYLDALNESGSGARAMADALDAAAAAANNAATSLTSVAGAAAGGPSGGVKGALGAVVGAVSGGGSSGNADLSAKLPSSFYKSGVKVGSGVGDNIIFKALGGLGVITENLRSQATQDRLFRQGKTPARVSDHTTSQNAYDYRLPAGTSYAAATAAIRKTAKDMGYELVKAIDETVSGGTGPHGHYVFGGNGRQAPAAAAATAPTVGGVPTSIAEKSIKTVADLAQSVAGKTAAASGVGTSDSDVVVTGPSRAARNAAGGAAPTLADVYNMQGRAIGDQLDKVFGSKFFGKIGGQLGTALQGAQTGVMVSGLAKSIFGLKQSKTGAAIGGGVGAVAGTAIGGPVGGKIGAAVGGVIGGTIGGALKENKVNWKAVIAATALFGVGGGLIAGLLTAKGKKGSVTLGGDKGEVTIGKATGNDAKYKKTATALGGSVSDALSQVADSLDATIGSFSVSIGKKKGKFVVDTGGQGRTKTGIAGDGVKGYDTEEEAVRAAMEDAIRDGALMGISAAGKALLTSGKSIEAQIRKVQIIESIPKRLMALKDPVRYAVTELNREFAEMIRYLQEGGATAAQFAEAQQLYDLERANAIKQATEQTTKAIQDMIDSMTSGQESPLNRRTVYENAQTALGRFTGDVAAGKPVDTDAFLKAVQDFQAASQALNGSNSSFFADFDYLLGLLTRARDNVTATQTPATALPTSPFNDADIQRIIAGSSGTTDAVNTQTEVLGGLLGDLIGRLDGGRLGSPSAIDALPSASYGGGGARYNLDISSV